VPLIIRRNELLIRLALIVLAAAILLGTIGHVYADERSARNDERLKIVEHDIERITLTNLPERVAKMEERQVRTAEDVTEIKTLLKGIIGAIGLLLTGKFMDLVKNR